MAAHTDDSVSGGVQANVALEVGPFPLAFPAAAAAVARSVAVAAALSCGKPSSAGGPAVTREAGIRGRHDVSCRTGKQRGTASQSNFSGARLELI